MHGAGGTRSLHARPPAMARSTGDDAVEGEICYVPSRYAGGTATLFDLPDAARAAAAPTIRCAARIVLTEGFSMPGPVQAPSSAAAPSAQIYIHPGENVHEGICTSIWGAPTAESIGRKPTTPVVCINHPDGEALIADVQRGAGARVDQDLAARRLDALPAAGRRDPRAARIPTSSCSCTATTTPGTRASATTPPATPRCSSWRACCGACAIG